jgi:hypothetical protein
MDEDGEFDGIKISRRNRITWRNLSSVPLRLPQIPDGFT